STRPPTSVTCWPSDSSLPLTSVNRPLAVSSLVSRPPSLVSTATSAASAPPSLVSVADSVLPIAPSLVSVADSVWSMALTRSYWSSSRSSRRSSLVGKLVLYRASEQLAHAVGGGRLVSAKQDVVSRLIHDAPSEGVAHPGAG